MGKWEYSLLFSRIYDDFISIRLITAMETGLGQAAFGSGGKGW